MLRRILFIGGACLGVALMVSPAMGVRNPPKKANKYQATVVQGMEVCTAATNTKAPGVLGTPACSPAVPSDPGCVFTEKGGGKVKAGAKDDVKIGVGLKGIDAACEGETLCAVASITSTANNCVSPSEPDCTSAQANTTDLPLGISCCTIEKGKCKIKTSINVALPGALTIGNNSEFQLGEVGLLRTGLPPHGPGNRAPAAFRAGIMVP